MKINHVCQNNNWINPEEIKEATTLILGSFNPFNPIGQNTDYYYGRQSNYFWKVVATSLEMNEDYFADNLENKLKVMKEYKFCFLDVISSIEVSSPDRNEELIDDYVENKIFSNYLDQTLFTTKTSFKGQEIRIKRNYNHSVTSLLNNGNFKKVIHTMGNNRISTALRAVPLEKKLEKDGFQGYINAINDLGVTFEPLSFSPSGYAVHSGGKEHSINLNNWLSSNLGLK